MKISDEDQDSVSAVKISAIFHDAVSVTGEHTSLERFQSATMRSPAQFRRAHIHGNYHGGEKMQEAVTRVMEDVERRNISFPNWYSLQVPIRSLSFSSSSSSLSPSSTDDLANEESTCNNTLLKCLLDSIFVHVADWKTTQSDIWESILSQLHNNEQLECRVVGFGPGVESLITFPHNKFQNEEKGTTVAAGDASNDSPFAHPRLSLVGTVFNALEQEDEEDGIAIVGLSANYPMGDGVDEFWQTIRDAKSALGDVSTFYCSTFKVLKAHFYI